MFQNNLSSITGVAIYPLISFVAFFLFFIAVGIYIFTQDKQQIKELSELPFSDKTIPGQKKINN